MQWALGLLQGWCRTVQPVASPIPNTLSQLPYKIGTKNTKCTTIQTFSKFPLFGYNIKNDIPQHIPLAKYHPASSCKQERPYMSDPVFLEAMKHDHLLSVPVEPLYEKTWQAVL